MKPYIIRIAVLVVLLWVLAGCRMTTDNMFIPVIDNYWGPNISGVYQTWDKDGQPLNRYEVSPQHGNVFRYVVTNLKAGKVTEYSTVQLHAMNSGDVVMQYWDELEEYYLLYILRPTATGIDLYDVADAARFAALGRAMGYEMHEYMDMDDLSAVNVLSMMSA
ncbi:MAG: hypothetical protein KKC99_05225, partial [Proteobacteria bacterium]|nr:hypothetical protein [Pseudomonadota bacterium]